MSVKNIVVLSSVAPSPNCAFKRQEIAALRRWRLSITSFSVTRGAVIPEAACGDQRVSQDRSAFPVLAVQRFLRQALRNPAACVHGLRLLKHDMLEGESRSLRLKLNLVRCFMIALIFAAEVERCEADHILVYEDGDPATIAMYAAQITGIPFSVTSLGPASSACPTLMPAKLKRSTMFRVNNDADRRDMIELWGPRAGRVLVIGSLQLAKGRDQGAIARTFLAQLAETASESVNTSRHEIPCCTDVAISHS